MQGKYLLLIDNRWLIKEICKRLIVVYVIKKYKKYDEENTVANVVG